MHASVSPAGKPTTMSNQIIQTEPHMHILLLKPGVHGKHRCDRSRDVGSIGQHEPSLMQRFRHKSVLLAVEMLDCVFQITDASMKQIGRSTRRTRGKVIPFNESHLVSSKGSIQRNHGSCASSTNHRDVELLSLQPVDHVNMKDSMASQKKGYVLSRRRLRVVVRDPIHLFTRVEEGLQ